MGNAHPVIKAKEEEEAKQDELSEHAMEVMARIKKMFDDERAKWVQPPNLLAFPVKDRKEVLKQWHKRLVLHRLREAVREVRRRWAAGHEDVDLKDVIMDIGKSKQAQQLGHVDYGLAKGPNLKRRNSFRWDQALGLQKITNAGAAASGVRVENGKPGGGGIGEGHLLRLVQALSVRQTRTIALEELLEHSENAFRAREIVEAGALEPLSRLAVEKGQHRLAALTVIRNTTRGEPETARKAARALKVDEILLLIEDSLDDLDAHQMAYNVLKNMTEAPDIARLFIRGGFHTAILNDLLNPFIQNEYRVAPAAVLANLLRLDPIPRGVIERDIMKIVRSMVQHPNARVHLQGIRCAKHLARDQEAAKQLIGLQTTPLLVGHLESDHDEVVMEAVNALANYSRNNDSHLAMAPPDVVRTLVILSRAGLPRIERGAALTLARLARNPALRGTVESQEGLFALLPYAQMEPKPGNAEDKELHDAAAEALWPGTRVQRQAQILAALRRSGADDKEADEAEEKFRLEAMLMAKGKDVPKVHPRTRWRRVLRLIREYKRREEENKSDGEGGRSDGKEGQEGVPRARVARQSSFGKEDKNGPPRGPVPGLPGREEGGRPPLRRSSSMPRFLQQLVDGVNKAREERGRSPGASPGHSPGASPSYTPEPEEQEAAAPEEEEEAQPTPEQKAEQEAAARAMAHAAQMHAMAQAQAMAILQAQAAREAAWLQDYWRAHAEAQSQRAAALHARFRSLAPEHRDRLRSAPKEEPPPHSPALPPVDGRPLCSRPPNLVMNSASFNSSDSSPLSASELPASAVTPPPHPPPPQPEVFSPPRSPTAPPREAIELLAARSRAPRSLLRLRVDSPTIWADPTAPTPAPRPFPSPVPFFPPEPAAKSHRTFGRSAARVPQPPAGPPGPRGGRPAPLVFDPGPGQPAAPSARLRTKA